MAGGNGKGRARPDASAAPEPKRASIKPHDLFLDSLWLSDSSTIFNGSNSMSDFEAELGVAKSSPFLHSGEAGNYEEVEEDLELDVCFPLQGKKRRLSAHQVQFLERSFEVENRLDPDRKAQLAKDLGLHPRQVAVWFQNRRARFKTKRIEKDYDSLKASLDSLKANYDSLLKEKDELKLQVDSLKHKLHQTEEFKDTAMTSSKSFHPWLSQSNHQESAANEAPKLQEDSTSAKSDVFDYESPHLTGYSSQGLEPESSEIEDGNSPPKMGMEFPAPLSYFPKIEEEDYASCTFGFSSSSSSEDAFWNWAY